MNIPEMATAFYEKGFEPVPCSPGKKYYRGVDYFERLNSRECSPDNIGRE